MREEPENVKPFEMQEAGRIVADVILLYPFPDGKIILLEMREGSIIVIKGLISAESEILQIHRLPADERGDISAAQSSGQGKCVFGILRNFKRDAFFSIGFQKFLALTFQYHIPELIGGNIKTGGDHRKE